MTHTIPHTPQGHHSHHITWQHAVYTRRNNRELYTFSHADTTTVQKAFPSSLSVPSLLQSASIHQRNLHTLRNATVLVLVTGQWAVHVSIEAFQASKNSVHKLPLTRYDHLGRMGKLNTAECAELTEDYRALKYHCTMASYEAGPSHTWKLGSVGQFLSDVVILPKILDERRLGTVMSSFCRATRKSLRDSVLLAGEGRVREETLVK